MEDKENINKLVLENKGLAHKVLWKYYSKVASNIEFEDAESICFEGLLKAAKTFDASKGFNFSTYAFTVIKNNLLKFSMRQTEKMNGAIVVSLDSDLTGEDEDFNLKNILPSDYNLEEDAESNEELQLLRTFINELPEKYRQVMQLKLAGYSQYDIAEKLKVSQTEISSYYLKSMNILRYKFAQKGMI